MNRLLAVILILCLSLSLFAGCSKAESDSAEEYVDAQGNIIAADSDDSDLATFDEENEIKTDAAGEVISTFSDGSAAFESAEAAEAQVAEETAANTSDAGSSASDSDLADLPQIDINLSEKTVSDSDYAVFNGSTLFISQSGDYTLVGNFYGCVEVEMDYNEVVRLRLVGVNIVNTTGPAIQFVNLASTEENSDEANNPNNESGVEDDQQVEMNQPDAIISFIDGTTSTLEVRDYSPNDMSGTIDSEVSLSIRGQGSGIIKNSNQNAIHCLKSIAVKNASLTLSAPAGRGIYTKARYENDENCTVKISAYRDAVKCDKFYMSGGTLIACSADNDAIDTDDRAIISGGVLLADSGDIYNNYGIKVRRVLENTVRADKNDTFSITGGTVLACGGYNTVPSADTTTQCAAVLQSGDYAQSTTLAVRGATGDTIMTFAVDAKRPSLLISGAGLAQGCGYSVFTGVSADDAAAVLSIDDSIIIDSVTLYDGASASGGTAAEDFSFDSTVLSQ